MKRKILPDVTYAVVGTKTNGNKLIEIFQQEAARESFTIRDRSSWGSESGIIKFEVEKDIPFTVMEKVMTAMSNEIQDSFFLGLASDTEHKANAEAIASLKKKALLSVKAP